MKFLYTVSTPKHFHWLPYALRSVAKYAEGFDRWVILLPSCCRSDTTLAFIRANYDQHSPKIPLELIWFNEWPERGFLHHEWLVTSADLVCPEATYFCNWDTDMIMLAATHVDEFWRDGIPMLGWQKFADTIRYSPASQNWAIAAEKALGWPVEVDTMRWFPIIHDRDTLAKTRECILQHTGVDPETYVRTSRNEPPHGYGYAEYNTIGPVAWKFFHDRYAWVQGFHPAVKKQHKGWTFNPVTQKDLAIFSQAGLA